MKDKFLGETKGNRDLNPNRSTGGGGSGESHTFNTSKYAGAPTKGNKDLPPDRSSGK